MDDLVYLTYLGARIAQFRTERGMTQIDLAKAIGMNSKSQIVKIEHGQVNSSIIQVKKIAEALGTTLDELVRG